MLPGRSGGDGKSCFQVSTVEWPTFSYADGRGGLAPISVVPSGAGGTRKRTPFSYVANVRNRPKADISRPALRRSWSRLQVALIPAYYEQKWHALAAAHEE